MAAMIFVRRTAFALLACAGLSLVSWAASASCPAGSFTGPAGFPSRGELHIAQLPAGGYQAAQLDPNCNLYVSPPAATTGNFASYTTSGTAGNWTTLFTSAPHGFWIENDTSSYMCIGVSGQTGTTTCSATPSSGQIKLLPAGSYFSWGNAFGTVSIACSAASCSINGGTY